MGPPKVRGCAFHFAKSLNKKRDELGLRTLCRDDVDVKEFFIRLRHLPFVPDDFRLQFAGDLLAARPHQPPLHAARLEQLVRYFTNFWLSNNIVKEFWGQFGNRGPRTTNMTTWRAVEDHHRVVVAAAGLEGVLSEGDRHPSLASGMSPKSSRLPGQCSRGDSSSTRAPRKRSLPWGIRSVLPNELHKQPRLHKRPHQRRRHPHLRSLHLKRRGETASTCKSFRSSFRSCRGSEPRSQNAPARESWARRYRSVASLAAILVAWRWRLRQTVLLQAALRLDSLGKLCSEELGRRDDGNARIRSGF
ncbi:hypothetical protein HPB47_007292 [Ixodes persulcatus]|uniref:Uncharacterized protein n=1 Tax=Ixodes persulcatus TaxID=34615 RepID=A0AC60P7T9_IXOPE|nr:hypothetical protein HPB47_007292 [Ixodes persulcatus]